MNAIASMAAPAGAGGLFSLDVSRIDDILEHASPLGHRADAAGLNLGFGFLYYALARALRPEHVAVVGSGTAFSAVCFALGLKDNGGGCLSLVETPRSPCPLSRFGVEGIVTRYEMSSAAFFGRYDEPELAAIDLAFIGAGQPMGHVREDFIAVMGHTRRNSYILLHDTNLHIRDTMRASEVRRWLAVLRRDPDTFEIVDFPFSAGLAMVRVLRDGPWHPGA